MMLIIDNFIQSEYNCVGNQYKFEVETERGSRMRRIKRSGCVLAGVGILLIMLCGRQCKHQWNAATCTDAKFCSLCGETNGEALGHDWVDATCESAKYCERCGLISGEELGHDWVDATCEDPVTCSRCGEENGEPLGHDWADATCTTAKVCVVCGKEDGEPLGHSVSEWTVEAKATCVEHGSEVGVCEVCGEVISRETEFVEHIAGDWEITKEATSSSAGERIKACTVCGEELESESYELSEEEIFQKFKSECTYYSYETLARDPDKYFFEKVKLDGEVVQVIEDGDDYILRVNMTQGKYYWTDTIYVEYTKKDSSESRILEDDIISIYGYAMGTITYETVLGAQKTIPAVLAKYIRFW